MTALKKLDEQVVVVTGATSGIGLAIVREAVKRGAKVVMTARNEEDLARIASEINLAGGFALPVAADVADPHAVDRVRDAALARFGTIDTWINNAGVSIFGKLRDVDLVEARRLFDVNLWGVVHGSRAAMSVMREKGGAIINIGSVLSDRVVPIQGMVAASKHAVKAYTDALRIEAAMEGLPVVVTLVKPNAVDTPYSEHAREIGGAKWKTEGPLYAPELVAEVVLFCAEHPRRNVTVGGGGKIFRAFDNAVGEEKAAPLSQRRPELFGDSLFAPPLVEGKVHGRQKGLVTRHSVATTLELHPLASTVALAGAGLIAAAAVMLWARASSGG